MRHRHVASLACLPDASSRRVRRGVTLIEVLIVLIIVGIVSAIALPTFMGGRSAVDETEMRTDVQRLQFQARAYYDAHGTFPSTPAGWTTAPTPGLDFRPSPGLRYELAPSPDGQSLNAYVSPIAPPYRYCVRALGGVDTGVGVQCVTP